MAADQRKPGNPPTDSFIARIDARIDERARKLTDELIASGGAVTEKRSIGMLASLVDREIRATVTGLSELRVKGAGSTIVLTGTAAAESVRQRASVIATELAPDATIDNFIVVKR